MTYIGSVSFDASKKRSISSHNVVAQCSIVGPFHARSVSIASRTPIARAWKENMKKGNKKKNRSASSFLPNADALKWDMWNLMIALRSDAIITCPRAVHPSTIDYSYKEWEGQFEMQTLRAQRCIYKLIVLLSSIDIQTQKKNSWNRVTYHLYSSNTKKIF